MFQLLFDPALDWQTKLLVAATLIVVVLALVVFPIYLLCGGLRTFGLRPLERCFRGIRLHETPEIGDVCVRYHSYRGFLLWVTQQEHVFVLPARDAERLLGRLLRYNLTWGMLSYGMLFIPLLSIGNYFAQRRSIREQSAGGNADTQRTMLRRQGPGDGERSATEQPISVESIEGASESINDFLRQLFQGHDVDTALQSGHITFPDHPGLWADGALFRSYEQVVQLDFRLGGFDGDRVLIESIAGIGEDLNAQATFAVQAFANASFHVLLPAFFVRPPCHGTERATWAIGGTPRAVYPGLITTVFGYPPPAPDGAPELSFYPAFIKRLEQCALPKGVHWVRIYQARRNGDVLANEVLLDNDAWVEMQDFMADQPWPIAEQPYDVRTFLVIKDVE